jgi:NADH:ubiquinone oxidoreductase subunit 5 (subunit L)/multisubunit Na+/H+ antiporter MnhA subunit
VTAALLVAAVLLPLVAAAVAAPAGPARVEWTGRAGVLVAGASFVLSVVLTVAIVRGGPVSAVVAGGGGDARFGLIADQARIVLLLLVFGVSAVVQSFARRYLRGDARAARFFAAAGLLTGSTAGLVTSVTLIPFAVAWTVAGVALCLLLGLYWHLPAARHGVRRTVRAFAIGDIGLWVAVVLLTIQQGTVDLRQLGGTAAALDDDPVLVAVIACLLVLAAVARSAQLPLQSWLPATLAAPTPVSALLHAGVVNAGGVLLILLSPLFTASTLALSLAFVIGAATAVYGTALMLTKPDVKGALVHSTMGQMGFMIMTCGLGWFGAALFHLTAHGMYKATLFLGSGSAVHSQVRHRKAPPLPSISRAAVTGSAAAAVLLSAAAILAAVAVIRPSGGNAEVLLVFAWATAAWASWGWLRRHPSLSGVLVTAVSLLVLGFGYVLIIDIVTGFVDRALPAGAPGVSPWLLALPLAAMAVLALVRHAPQRWGASPIGRRLYVLALSAGYVRGEPRPPRRRQAVASAPLPRLASEVGA